jgi:hypothetical protein
MKTAIELFIEKMKYIGIIVPKESSKNLLELMYQAKEIEKTQIMDAWKHGKMMGNSQLDFSEEYYKKEFLK